MPADTTYKEWKKGFVDGGDKSGFEDVDNSKKGDIIKERNSSLNYRSNIVEKSALGVDNLEENDIIKEIDEMFRKKVYSARANVKPVRDDVFNGLITNAKKHGATIIKCEYGDEWFLHLEKNNATASCIGESIIIFRPDATISEVLEETYHFEQNYIGLNNDKEHTLRTILNEIDAKQYILNNAKKYSIPRNEIEEIQSHLKQYQEELNKYYKKE